MKGITKSGFEYEVDDNMVNNMELIDALVDIQNGSTGAVSDLLNCMFDKAQKKIAACKTRADLQSLNEKFQSLWQYQPYIDAINNKYRILINYDDEDNHATGIRLVEPYVLGYTKAGNLAFRGYQYNGDTVRGVPKWKLFRLDRVINWQPTKQKFNVDIIME